MNVNKKQKNSGFTLIEMLVAVFIFTVSLTALMSITSRGLKASRQAQNQVIGNYLALEGIEVVRNIRDTALLSLNDVGTWQNVFDQNECLSQIGINSSCQFTLGSNIVLSPCTTCNVYFSETDFAYRHNQSQGYVDSGFTRRIKFTAVPSNDSEIIVTVVVEWDGGEVTYTQDLFLWL
ncbi:MAG: prepilin-type N-terminal cleavage/methylation domain-containing protein [Candidatus Paceibacteria bacterium]|jgi:prepilin-type N-terminal cleavage/methylation domain-containing protein